MSHHPAVRNHPRVDTSPFISYRLSSMNDECLVACCPPAREGDGQGPVEGPEANAELATLAKAIAHPVRVEILRILVRKNTCICGAIVDELPLAQSTVSQHLKILKEAGLLRGEVDGPRVSYCIEPLTLRRLKDLVGGL